MDFFVSEAKKEILEEILVETKLSSLNFEAESTPKENSRLSITTSAAKMYVRVVCILC